MQSANKCPKCGLGNYTHGSALYRYFSCGHAYEKPLCGDSEKGRISFRACVNDGIVLGLKESLKSLNQFLDRKVAKGYPEYISRAELQTFLETYIKETEENFR